MSAQSSLICGRAVFLTWRGLEARGNGILAGVQESPSVFEFGRNRAHPLHKLNGKQRSVLFCRRGIGVGRGREVEIEIVGIVAPTKDAEGRRGFFGACVAVDVDRRRPGGFGNWSGWAKEIGELFSRTREVIDARRSNSFLREVSLPATDHDEKVDWTSTTSEEMLFQCDGEAEDVSSAKVFEYLQAIAFKGGTNHPTVLVFGDSVSGSRSLVSDENGEWLRLLNEAKAEQLERGDVVGEPSDEPVDTEAQALTISTLERITRLETRVRHLEKIVAARPSGAVVSTASPTYGEEAFPVWLIVGIAAGVLAIAAGVLTYFVLVA